MRRLLAIVLIFASFALVSARDAKTIDPLRAAFVAAFDKGDAATMQKLFEPEVLLLSVSGQPARGGAAIARGMAGMSSQMDLELNPMQSRESGDMLYEAGTWNHNAKGSKTVVQTGTYVWIWKKEKDGWRIETMSVTAARGTPIGS